MSIFANVDHLFGKIKPQKLFFMAVDDVARGGPVHEDDTMISVGIDHFAHEFFADNNL